MNAELKHIGPILDAWDALPNDVRESEEMRVLNGHMRLLKSDADRLHPSEPKELCLQRLNVNLAQ